MGGKFRLRGGVQAGLTHLGGPCRRALPSQQEGAAGGRRIVFQGKADLPPAGEFDIELGQRWLRSMP
jgi:hypothetical protein